jgi:hypothetical protein
MEWQPIETAPIGGSIILGFIPADEYHDGWTGPVWHDGDEWLSDGIPIGDGAVCIACEPTHWMPLPAPPA